MWSKSDSEYVMNKPAGEPQDATEFKDMPEPGHPENPYSPVIELPARQEYKELLVGQKIFKLNEHALAS